MTRRYAVRGFALALALLGAAAAGATLQARTNDPDIRELWDASVEIEAQDLFHGPWGAAHAPHPDAVYRFVKPKQGGINPGMTVTDPQGRTWKVKQPPTTGRTAEGPIEVVLSRVLSGIGYHQPPVYYLDSFMLANDSGRTRRVAGGRFRAKVDTLDDLGEWSWRENPHAGTRPHHGLLVILLMFNSSDLKNSNNTLYAVAPPASATVTRWYVVRDLGTALGSTARIAPKRGDIEEFERRGFIQRVAPNGRVDFHYDGRHQDLVDGRVTPEDVRWASALLSRLTLAQWHDAFRAGGYAPEISERFIKRLQQKIREGLACGTS